MDITTELCSLSDTQKYQVPLRTMRLTLHDFHWWPVLLIKSIHRYFTASEKTSISSAKKKGQGLGERTYLNYSMKWKSEVGWVSSWGCRFSFV